MKIWLKFLVSVCVVFLSLPAFSYEAEDKIYSQSGTIPVILTVPHDGDELLGWIGTRKNGFTGRDSGSRDLAERTALALEKKLGGRPYLVVAKFSRKYLDANRAENEALESPEAIPAYRAYHGKIASYVEEIKSKFPDGAILIDVHAQGDDARTLFRGTRNGLTAKELIKKSGKEALSGASSILGLLESKGYQVAPSSADPEAKEDSRFSGGYTVYLYGSQRKAGIDSIQIEFGQAEIAKINLAEDLAEAVAVFSRKYIPYFSKNGVQ